MKSRSSLLWKLALYVFVSFIAVSDSSQSVAEDDKSGFISIDCGASRDYVDEATGIWYQTDEGFIENESGTPQEVAPNVNFNSHAPTINRQLMTLRSFPEGKRNCYTLKPKQESQKHKYLIRAIFSYGNYDFDNRPPVFELYLGVNYWTTVRAYSARIFAFEVIMEHDDSNTESTVQVCLVNTGEGTPFINSLELRPLNYSIYPSPLPLIIDDMSSFRIDSGSGLPNTWSRGYLGSGLLRTWTRYKDDVYDRLWWNNAYADWDVLQTSAEESKAHDSVYELPWEVLRTASQPQNHTNLLTFNWSIYDAVPSQYYLFLHFSEIEKLPPGRNRIIDVTFDDENSSPQQLTLEYLKPITLRSNKITNGNYITFTIRATTDSHAPPILNAFEAYKVLPQLNSPTAAQDVKAMIEIKRVYRVSKISWQGDPCVPSHLAWDCLNCSQDNNNTRIISLNLSSSKLTGVIEPSFAGLEKLQSLDLSNNELTGSLPEFLATLPNLKFINVTGNKLTGSVPKALREKANLELSVGNNPGLCPSSSCQEVKEHNKFVIPLVASLSTLAVVTVLIVSSLVIWRFKTKKEPCKKKDVLKAKNQTFSYSEVVCITNNFENIIGEGGFGKVYLGTLEDDTQVAVKLLSPSSRQGYKEFQSEAQLLAAFIIET